MLVKQKFLDCFNYSNRHTYYMYIFIYTRTHNCNFMTLKTVSQLEMLRLCVTAICKASSSSPGVVFGHAK